MSPDQKVLGSCDKTANKGRIPDKKYQAPRTFSGDFNAFRERVAEERRRFDEETAPLKFTKDFNTSLEALMRDELVPNGYRVLAWVKRTSWGNYSLYAVNDDCSPAWQRDCAAAIGISKQRVCDSISYLEHRGHLRIDRENGKRIYPVINPELRMPDPGAPEPREFSQFKEWWEVACSTDFQALEVTRSEYNRLRKVQLEAYKQWRASRTNDGPSLNESLRVKPESNNNNDLSVEEDPASPQKSVVVVPPFPLKESLIAFLQGLPIPTSIPPGLPAEILYHLPNEQALGMFMEAVNRQQPRSWAFPFLKVAKSCAARQPTYTPPPADLPPGVDAEQFRRLCERHGIPT